MAINAIAMVESKMAHGRRNSFQQHDLFITAVDLPRSVGHAFYAKLNQLLEQAGFDTWIEKLCAPYYSQVRGRPGIPPGVYFRMLLVGYFEGIQSQRGIAWRCADSLSIRQFLGLKRTDQFPDHSSLTVIRERLPETVHASVFEWVLRLANEKKLLGGKTVAVDKGYHSTEALTELSEHTNYGSSIPEPKTPDGRNWSKPPSRNARRFWRIGDEQKEIKVANFRGCEASKWNDTSRTFWRQVEDAAVGYAVPRRTKSGTS